MPSTCVGAYLSDQPQGSHAPTSHQEDDNTNKTTDPSDYRDDDTTRGRALAGAVPRPERKRAQVGTRTMTSGTAACRAAKVGKGRSVKHVCPCKHTVQSGRSFETTSRKPFEQGRQGSSEKQTGIEDPLNLQRLSRQSL